MKTRLMTSPRAESNRSGRHAEIKRRYAWQARTKNTESKKPDRNRLITLVRMHELERVFQHRYGRFLPDDDSGVDDFTLMAHHIAQLPGSALPRIVAWARAWAPWMSPTQAAEIAHRVMENPLRFTADVLAWRLRLSMVDRTHLRITTIGAFDLSKAERQEDRKRKKREAERIRRAKNSSGRPRGRPRKEAIENAWTADKDNIGVHGFSDRAVPAEVVTVTTPPASATPPAIASGTPNKSNRLVVDAAGVGGHDTHRLKTRFPTAMRLNRQMMAIAVERGFDLRATGNMWEHFRNWNVAMRSYSADWCQAWENWLDRQVTMDTEEHHRRRTRAWLAAGAPA